MYIDVGQPTAFTINEIDESPTMTTNENAEPTSETPDTNDSLQTQLSDVTPATMVGFLLGRKDSILAIYNCPKILWIGAMLVLSAGFAREYDGEDLLSEPWHVLIPHAASLLTSLLLYAMLRLPAVRSKAAFRRVVKDYPRFLALFWLTAPIAWLYAIPFERWLDAGVATRVNLSLLGIVSVWRVVLIIRSAVVVYKPTKSTPVSITVLLFGDAVMLAAVRLVPVPIFQLMGGVRLTESESVIWATTFFLQLAGYPVLLVLLVLYLVTLPPTRIEQASHDSPSSRLNYASWLVAFASVAVWAFVLPFTQPEQQKRCDVEQRMAAGDLQGAVDFMVQHRQRDFPPHWSPPPQIALYPQDVELTDVMQIVLDLESDSWVKQVYMDKFLRKLPDVLGRFSRLSSPQLPAFVRILRRVPLEVWFPPNDEQLDEVAGAFRIIANDPGDEFSEELQADAAAILEMINATAEETPAEPDETGASENSEVLANPALGA